MATLKLLGSKRAGLRALTCVASACLVAAALAAPATAQRGAAHAAGASAAHQAADRTPDATLRGSKEVPGPGDPNGHGDVRLTLKPAARKVCAAASWQRIGTPIMAHVHRGRAGMEGSVVVDLTSAVTGGSHCATGVSRALIHQISAAPRHFYFNIHTDAYPNGAIRGQLH